LLTTQGGSTSDERGLCPGCGAVVEGRGDCASCGAAPLVGSCLLLEALIDGRDGVLYSARDSRTGRLVALRLLPESPSVEEWIAAARRATSLVHPHLAAVLDVGVYRGRAYVVYQDAGDAAITASDLSLREAVGLIRDAATGVEYAAGRGSVHPGLQPDSLRLTSKGHVFVIGYESGRRPAAAPYQSPEVRAGRAVDPPANVYSLGAILYELAVGRAPDPEAPEAPSSANPLVPGDVEDLILKAMEADPKRRPGASAFAAGLTRWLDGQGTPAPARTPSAPRPAWRRVPYATPERGLYICSSSTPPGGGVHGMCGYLAARAALRRSL